MPPKFCSVLKKRTKMAGITPKKAYRLAILRWWIFTDERQHGKDSTRPWPIVLYFLAKVHLTLVVSSRKRPRLANEGPVKVPKKLLQLVREGTWPFLRSSALFYHFVTGIAAPASLKKDNREYFVALSSWFSEDAANELAG